MDDNVNVANLTLTPPALFTVEVDSLSHVAEFHGDVTMGCRFQPGGWDPKLSVVWQRVQPLPDVEVYRMDNGQEDLTSQNLQYHGRARLVSEELTNGWAKLHVSSLRINDSGVYRCLVELGGADYKQTTLTVKATYKTIIKSMQRRGGDEVELACESEGYPLATINWRDKSLRNIKSNDTVVKTPDQLFHVTSKIMVKYSEKNNYTCALVEKGEATKGPSARFDIPDEIPVIESKPNTLSIVLGTTLTVAMIIAATIFGYRRQKGRLRTLKLYHPPGLNRDVTSDLPGPLLAAPTDPGDRLFVTVSDLYQEATEKETPH
uniref:Programmed cell death 1 ligand 1 n=1 Tax=Oncorhynchus kisutch TaxID=8019 RepID=A0A8C7J1H7_ONCKI